MNLREEIAILNSICIFHNAIRVHVSDFVKIQEIKCKVKMRYEQLSSEKILRETSPCPKELSDLDLSYKPLGQKVIKAF